MINRVLIRIKVVQMLYSYLLTERVFSVESQPTPPTRASRAGYALYLDLLALMTLIAEGLTKRGGVKPLANNRFTRAVGADEKVRSVIRRSRTEPSPLLSPEIVASLTEEAAASALVRDYAKLESHDMASDLKLWRDLYRALLLQSPQIKQAISQMPELSLRSREIAEQLMEETFFNFSSSQSSLKDVLRTLDHSLNLARELYLRLMLLPVYLTDLQAKNLEEARTRYIVSDEDLHPNMRFVDNEFVEALRSNPTLAPLLEAGKLTWDPQLLQTLLHAVTSCDEYRNYMEAPQTDYHGDCEFWRRMFKFVILPGTPLNEALEDKSVFWNDDIDIIGTFVLKTVRRFSEYPDKLADPDTPAPEDPVLPMYKDREDSLFGAELFSEAVKNRSQYKALIDSVLNKETWETDRLAFMDVVICITALAEILNFPKIPLTVSINEYIEITKAYSTSKSGYFVHGILGAAIAQLKNEGKLLKN